MRRTTTALLAAVLALAGCSSSGSDESATSKTPSATAAATVTASPSLSRGETMRLCSVAVSEAAPGWEDWNFPPGEWSDDPRTPKECQQLKDDEDPTRGNRDFMEALIDGLEIADDPRARS